MTGDTKLKKKLDNEHDSSNECIQLLQGKSNPEELWNERKVLDVRDGQLVTTWGCCA